MAIPGVAVNHGTNSDLNLIDYVRIAYFSLTNFDKYIHNKPQKITFARHHSIMARRLKDAKSSF